MSGFAITGLGAVTPLGCGVDVLWSRLVAGERAVAPAPELDPRAPAALAARVGEIPAKEFLAATLLRRMDRLARMMCVAAAMAAEDAGLVVRAAGAEGAPLVHDAARAPADDVAVVAGSAFGNLAETAQFLDRVFGKGPAVANPMLFPNTVMNAAASQLAIAFGWRGPNLTLSEGEISGEIALHAATEMLERNRARAVVVVAGDECAPVLFRSLRDLGIASPRGGDREWSSPFDAGATGPVAGEGAAALVLEPVSARRSRARLARVRRGSSPGARVHAWPAAATPVSFASTPDLVLCGADSSPERDHHELALAAEAARTGARIGSLKGAVGEFGASGLLSVVVAALALERGVVPPLAALERPIDAGARFPRAAESLAITRAATIGSARGGAHAVVELEHA